MKIHTRISLTGLIVSLALGGLAGAREFSSADGSKTMSGTVTAVSPSSQTATIRKPDGRSITFPISAVAEKDREYLIDWYKAYEMGRKLDIRVNSTEEKGTERKTATARQYSVATQFDLELRNNASFDFEGLEVRYRMFHTKDSDKGKTEDRTTDGVLKVDEIFPRGEVSLGTESVSLEVQKPLPASQCPGGTWSKNAPPRASSRADRMEGIIVKVYKDGKKIKEVSYPSGLRKTWDDEEEESLASR